MTGAGVSLRRIAPLDASVLSALHSEGFGEERWDERAVGEILAMPGVFGFFSLEQGIPGGFVLARIAADECEILSLGVSLARRRAGLGRGLVQAVLEVAAGSGARAVHLEVAEDNEAAQRLYAAEGFAVTGRRPAYYRRADQDDVAALALSRSLA